MMFARLKRHGFRTVILVMTAAAFLIGLMPAGLEAQEVRQRKTLFDWLFGGQKRQQPDIIQLPERTKPRTKKRNSQSVTLLETSAPPVTKNPDARRVLVVGDFIASGLAQGLTAAFSQDAATIIEARPNNASGLVRDDFFDWQKKLPAYIADIKPAAIVLMIGANDRQQMRRAEGKADFDTPEWNAAYTGRVQSILKIGKDANIPLVWVGLPAFKSPKSSAAAVQFNTIYRNEASRVGAEFVDVWDGFVDENGKFIQSGSDHNGQPARLRTSDGVGLSAAGKRKLAFYVEKPIRKILGEPLTVEQLIRLDDQSLLATKASEKPSGPPVRTPPISLSDPELDGASELLGATGTTASLTTPITIGKEPAPPGRVDDFSRPSL